MDVKQAYYIYNKVASLERVKRSVETLCKMKIEHNLVGADIWFAKNIEKDGKYYPTEVSLSLSDLIDSLRMLEETLTQEVEKL